MAERKACLVIGAGDGVGASIARAFAREGLTACITRRARNLDQLEATAQSIRDEGLDAIAYGVDARDEAEMIALVDRIEAEVGPLEVVVFNIGANVWFPLTETTTRVYTKVWEMAGLSGFIAAREAARVMTPRGRGTILFSGAKHALRALAQSAARELGPKGVHVAHVICDGSIDGSFTRGRISDFQAKLDRDEILKPDEIAKNYVWLHNQQRSAWTFEIDLRPWTESW